MNANSPLDSLGEWYAAQCNDEWEHGFGIRIDTLDNPGWYVVIDLNGTALEQLHLEKRVVENSEQDWFRIEVKDKKFVGAGDPRKLGAIIEEFLEFADKYGAALSPP